MGILSWIVFGALAGWLASIIMGKNASMGAFANIAAGIAGALLGGFLLSFVGIGGVSGFNIQSIVVAIAGACLLLVIIDRFKK